MGKKIYIKENNLLKIKNAMAGDNISHSSFVHENKPPYEEDEFEIGGEGGNNDFFHINESRLNGIDLSEVGQVEYEWYFDEEEYAEWLQDCEFTDSEEARNQYYTEEVTYGVEYLDSETFHYMDSDQNLLYDDLVDLFGEKMAKQMLQNCIENGGGSFETFELYEDNSYDITSPNELNDIAMKLFRHGEYFKGCRGFILSNGVVVYTEAEHNEICMIPGIKDKFQFVELGNIRVLDKSVDIGAEPTYEQEVVLKQMLRCYDGEEFFLDIFHDGGEISASYPVCNPNYVLGEINRFYSEGIKPQGGGFYENKVIKEGNTFKEWFGNSILTDENGQPIKMYHGTDAVFNEFSKEHIGGHGSFEGYGFNFTPYESRARGYSHENVIEAYLRVENPMTTKSSKISLQQLVKIIAELDRDKPFTDTIVAAYEPAGYGEKWDERYYRRALPIAAKTIYQFNRENDYGDAGLYAEICLNGNADKIKTIEVFEKLGYDSAIFYDNYGRLNTVVVFEPNQIKRTSNKTFSNDSNVMDENMEAEVEANEVKLDSFKKRETLAPKIWNSFDLNPKVRLKLLDIADDFWDYVNITWIKRKGIHLTGSICNFNWSKFSDIDLHIIVDFSEIDERKDFVQEYFNSKKNEWNNEHSKLKIYGFPVELYVEDINAETASGGLYDLEENEWIKKPNSDNIKQIGLDKYEIKNKSAKLMTLIDNLYDEFNNTDDNAQLRDIGNRAHKLLNKIKRMRKFGLERGGESDSFNVMYKVLRRTDYLDKLWRMNSELYDKINSIGMDEGKILKIAENFIRRNINEEVVADGNANHNPFKKRWKYERDTLISYLTNYGEIMTSKENGKEYKVLYNQDLSGKLGINFCICIQWNSMTMEPGNVIYVRAYDKFTKRRFKPEFDTRGFDNIQGTADDNFLGKKVCF